MKIKTLLADITSSFHKVFRSNRDSKQPEDISFRLTDARSKATLQLLQEQQTQIVQLISNMAATHQRFLDYIDQQNPVSGESSQYSEIQHQLEVLHEKQLTLIEQMHQELGDYRRAELQEWRKSLFLDVIECIHQVETILEQRFDNACDDERDAYLGLRDMLVNTLRRRGVHSMDETHLQDRRCIRVVSTCPTNDKHLDQSLHHIHHQGFLYQDNVLCRAEIAINRYQPSNEGDDHAFNSSHCGN